MSLFQLKTNHRTANRFLETFAAEAGTSFLSNFEPVIMPKGTPLFNAGEPPRYVHFITSGMASVVNVMSDGEVVEVGLVGREGFAETLHLLGPEPSPVQCFIQVDATALRMGYERFKEEFERNRILHRLTLEYVQFQSMSLNQLSACNRLHAVQKRLARWLLMVKDRVGEDELRLTQEFLSEMLGSRRSSITVEAGILQSAGLIEYKRGTVRIVNREGLMDATCECYGVIQRMFANLYRTAEAEPATILTALSPEPVEMIEPVPEVI